MVQWMKQLQNSFSVRKLAVSVIGIITLLSIVAFAAYEVTKAEVTVKADDEAISVYTHASTVGEVLEENDIETGEHDLIEPPEHTEINEAMTISYIPARQIIVKRDGEREKVWTVEETVEDLLAELGINFKEHDYIEPGLKAELEEETPVVYMQAIEVTLSDDGEEETVWTTSSTVEELLEDQEVDLGELDRVEPAGDEELAEGAEVNVVRVEVVTDVIEETVDFATVTQNDSSLTQGTEEVKQQGREGKIEKHYEVVFENGEEVSRELIKEEEVRESKDRVVAVGTKKPAETVSRSSSSSSNSSGSSSSGGNSGGGSWQSYTATAYTAFCNGCSGVTATGIDLRANPDANVIAVDPSVIPLGSRVEVKGYGTFIAGDTGGAIKGRKIDIFMPDRSKVMNFGRRTVQVRVLD